MRTKTLLALILVCLTLGAYFPICARLFSPGQSEPAATGDAKFDRGREIFTQLGCNACHAKEGMGNERGPNLDEIASPEHRERIFEALIKPPTQPSEQYPDMVMPGGLIDHLSEEDTEALLYYLTHQTPSVE